MKFVPKAGKISKEDVKFYDKVTSCGKITSKSMIPSKDNVGEKQNPDYTWKFLCTHVSNMHTASSEIVPCYKRLR